jgi:hypothetical protein
MLQSGQVIRFNQNSRFGEWKKGDIGEIDRLLVGKPENQSNIYVVKRDSNPALIWVIDTEFSLYWRQMTLF